MPHTYNPDSPFLPCSRCQRTIQRTGQRSQACWSPLNSVAYGAEAENNPHKQKQLKYHYLCRACLLAGYEQEKENFFSVVTKKQRGKFHRYRYAGFFNKNDIVE